MFSPVGNKLSEWVTVEEGDSPQFLDLGDVTPANFNEILSKRTEDVGEGNDLYCHVVHCTHCYFPIHFICCMLQVKFERNAWNFFPVSPYPQ